MAGNQELFQKAMNQGHSAAWDQEWERAATYYRQALAEYPDHPQALSSLGLALFELQDFESALKCYQAAAKNAPNDPIPHEKMGRIYERQGMLNEAIQSFLQAAELSLKQKDVVKSNEAWIRVLDLEPDNLTARSRLATIYEKTNRKQEALYEYLASASIMQKRGDLARAVQVVEYCIKMLPDSREATLALNMLRNNQRLPQPSRPGGASAPVRAPVRMAEIRQLEGPAEEGFSSNQDPIAEARQKALVQLASLLFEQTDDAPGPRRGGLPAVSSEASGQKYLLHLGQAIDAQTQGQDAAAAQELEKAIEAGLKNPAGSFNLGYLLARQNNEKALRHLQQASRQTEFALAAYLMIGELSLQLGNLNNASNAFLQALSLADSQTVAPEYSEEVRQLYEPLLESQQHQKDPQRQKTLCESISRQLIRQNWQHHLKLARQQLPTPAIGQPPLPVASLLLESQSSQMVDALGRIRELAQYGMVRTAMEEAYFALSFGPTYLPLHTQISELLLLEQRTQEAVDKLIIISNLYMARNEPDPAIHLLRRVLSIAPSNVGVHNRLIELLSQRGRTEEALAQYMELAEFYYLMAELEQARQTYLNALSVAQQSRQNRQWGVKILTKVADIDMQTLNWRQALRIYEQIRTLQPDDLATRSQLVSLNFKLSRESTALSEIDNFSTYLEGAGKRAQAIEFVTGLLSEYPEQIGLRRLLADLFIRARQYPKAIEQLDLLADKLFAIGKTDEAQAMLEAIIRLNPPNVAEYQAALKQIRR